VSKSGAVANALVFLITVGLGWEVFKYLGVFVFSCPLQEVTTKVKARKIFRRNSCRVIALFFECMLTEQG
jgi:hypothetical protein